MNKKAKGTRNERKTIAILESMGYRCFRSSASLGEWDIIGISPKDFILVQVKSRDWPAEAEIERLKLFPAPPNCRKLIHRWRDRQRFPDVKEL